MDEQTFIYQRLNYLNEELIRVYSVLEKMMNEQGKIVDLIGKLDEKVDRVSSPEYIRKVNNVNQVKDIENKIKYMKEILK